MGQEEIAKLKSAVAAYKGQITRVEKYVAAQEQPDAKIDCETLRVRLVSVERAFQEYQNRFIELQALQEKTSEEEFETDETEEKYITVVTKINKLLRRHSQIDSQNADRKSAPADRGTDFRLPSLEISTFTGEDVAKYRPFIELFEAVIGSSKTLVPVQKLCYLKKYLSKEAEALIEGLPLVDSSYDAALQLLKDRYDNQCIIITNHVNQLLDCENILRGTTNNLRELASHVRQHIGALRNLGQPVDSWDMLLLPILMRKLDTYTCRAYHNERDKGKLPTMDDFLKFIESRASSYEESQKSIKNPSQKPSNNKVTMLSTSYPCLYCKTEGHKLFNCTKFKLISVSNRLQFVNENKLCAICLNSHVKKCKFFFKCSFCKSKAHNTLLHNTDSTDKMQSSKTETSNSSDNSIMSVTKESHNNITATTNTAMHHNKACKNVLLPTARVSITSQDGTQIIARALLDSGSQTSFVTSNLIKRLGNPTFRHDLNITTVGQHKQSVSRAANLCINSLTRQYSVNTVCSVVDVITTPLPQQNIPLSDINIPASLCLADPDFNVTDDIQLLLAADVFFDAILGGKCRTSQGIIFQNTKFGYVVTGQTGGNKNETVSFHCMTDRVDEMLEKFWEMETISDKTPTSKSEHEICEQQFQDSVTLTDNRFTVELPLKVPMDDINLGNTFNVASQCLNSILKLFQKNTEIQKRYTDFINEYVQQGHAKVLEVPIDKPFPKLHFLTHHPVIRDDKKTTKTRVVFNGNTKENGHCSLNEILNNGPVVQRDLFEILVLFRTYKFVFTCDVKAMFRQILLHPSHRFLQNILWKEKIDDELKILQLQTVTYGLKSSTFLATRCLIELVNKFGSQFPLAANMLVNNAYCDDVISGGDSIMEAISAKNQLIQLMKLGSFELHKWCANDDRILSDIPKNKLHFDDVDLGNNNTTLKILGLSFDIKNDVFKISSIQPKILNEPTKRAVLSYISSLFDPLGLAGPILIKAKIFMQKLWLANLDWDDYLPSSLHDEWSQFFHSIINMQSLYVDRYLNMSGAVSLQLIGYCDASQAAYGCCVYVRAVHNDKVSVSLLCAKSKVAPIKKCTVPKLELSSALLLSELIKKVNDILQISNVLLFSDSKIALAWIASTNNKLDRFVTNRVEKIIALTNMYSWYHVQGKDNPADLISRGVNPHQLVDNQLWWHGPGHLLDLVYQPVNEKIDWPIIKKEVCNAQIQKLPLLPLFENISSITKMQRVVAYILRFAYNCKRNNVNKIKGNLSALELSNAIDVIIRCVQQYYFQDVINSLKNNVKLTCNMNSLAPFIDKSGVLRVGGRLSNAEFLSYKEKHPAIMPKNCHVTDLIIVKEHLNLLHAGPKLTFCSLSYTYWIMNGIREVKRNLNKCIVCFKLRAKASEQLMGSLPADRITPCRVFQKVGMDFCGPFKIKNSRIRKSLETKGYVCIFICFVTKAIHMELTSDMTTEAFLAAFKRFISRRGLPAEVYCDNGSNFKGASKELNQLYKLQSNERHCNQIYDFCSSKGITFNFIPSYSPVFGSLWESAVKSAKYHFKRIIKDTAFTYEQFITIMIQVEAILNSRPLTPLSQDPTDFTYLTPGHFLVGCPLTMYPEPDCSLKPEGRVKFWQQCTRIQQSFWKVWHKLYLNQLQSRPKWKNKLPNIKVDQLVLMRYDNVAPLHWPVARVIRLLPGHDGLVRVIELKTADGKLHKRAVSKISLFPID